MARVGKKKNKRDKSRRFENEMRKRQKKIKSKIRKKGEK